jgi:hypothetical protein
MTDEHGPTQYLSADEMRVLRFAVRRQLTRWANKHDLDAGQQAQRATLQQVLNILEDNAFVGGCDLYVPSDE